MENYYRTLGLHSSATPDEIRRAYRILARRYHPDVNPGGHSEERFKAIAQAYSVLSDSSKRTAYDTELERFLKGEGRKQTGYQAYERSHSSATNIHGARRESARDRAKSRPFAPGQKPQKEKRKGVLESFKQQLKDTFSSAAPRPEPQPRSLGTKVSIIEVSIGLQEALIGTKKSVEIVEPEGSRKVSVRIPAGVRTGNVVHLRSTPKGSSPSFTEELIVVIRVASHPFVSLQPKGVVIEVPVTVQEAMFGASIQVPTFDDPIVMKIPPNSQSGHEIRVRERGLTQKDGVRGDLFYRLLIKIPESNIAVSIQENVAKLEQYYESSVRALVPTSLSEI